jgi:nitrogenase molybdenum-iron protein alpha chain
MGVWRTPRTACDWTEKSINAYIAEARPDIVIHFQRDEYEWRKEARPVLAFTPLFDAGDNCLWGYDSLASFAAALDRAVNAPWRKLLKPPWPEESG